MILCVGYAGVWAFVLTMANSGLSIENSWVNTTAVASFFCAITLYPAAAIGWFYRMQTGQRRWLLSTILAGLCLFGINAWSLYQFGERGPQGYDGLGILLAGLVCGVPLAVLTTALASAGPRQHRHTRWLGYGTLAGVLISAGLIAIEVSFNVEPVEIWIVLLGTIGAGLIALISSTIFGLKNLK